MQAPVIAAAAGFELLGFWFFDEEPNVADVLDPYHRGPIVAWHLRRDGPKPISIQLSVPDYESGMSAILRPDGVVMIPSINPGGTSTCGPKTLTAQTQAGEAKLSAARHEKPRGH